MKTIPFPFRPNPLWAIPTYIRFVWINYDSRFQFLKKRAFIQLPTLKIDRKSVVVIEKSNIIVSSAEECTKERGNLGDHL